MKTVAELLKNGCHFCKQPLTAETALVGTASYALAGSNVWSEPVVIVFCAACRDKHETHG